MGPYLEGYNGSHITLADEEVIKYTWQEIIIKVMECRSI
jgi:hypothetical protein